MQPLCTRFTVAAFFIESCSYCRSRRQADSGVSVKTYLYALPVEQVTMARLRRSNEK